MYTDFYNLKGSPFRLNPDHRFFFVAEPHKKAMAHLRYALNRNEGFVVITGEVGAGKTTMVNRILSDLEESRYVTGNIVTSFVEHDNLLPLIATTFGIEQEATDKASLLLAIRDFLDEQRALGQRPLLFVDEVQNLPASSLEELRMLSNFSLPGESLLQIFLVGQPEFRDTLAQEGMEQLRQRVVTSCHLGTLSAEDTRNYIHHRLKFADWKGSPEFSESALEAIHHLSGGVPRRINVICDRLLLHGFLEELERFGATAVASVARDMTEEGLLTAPAIVKGAGRQAQPEAEESSPVNNAPNVTAPDAPAPAEEPVEQPDAGIRLVADSLPVTETAPAVGTAESPAEIPAGDSETAEPTAAEADAEGNAAAGQNRTAVSQKNAGEDELQVGLPEAAEQEVSPPPPHGEEQPVSVPGRKAGLSGQALARYALAASILLAALILPQSPLRLLQESTSPEGDEIQVPIEVAEEGRRSNDTGSNDTSPNDTSPNDTGPHDKSAPDARSEVRPEPIEDPDQQELLFQEASDLSEAKLKATSVSRDAQPSDAVELTLLKPLPVPTTAEEEGAVAIAPTQPESLLKQGGAEPAPDATDTNGAQEDRFFIQLAALRSADQASELKVRFHERFKDLLAQFTLDVREAEIAGTRYFRLMTESGGNLVTMDRICGEIKASGQDCILVLDTAHAERGGN